MCITNRSDPSASIGEISAAPAAAMPQRKTNRRQTGIARVPSSRRTWRQRIKYAVVTVPSRRIGPGSKLQVAAAVTWRDGGASGTKQG